MIRRALVALALTVAAAACEPATPAARNELHWTACQAVGFSPQQIASCTSVIDSPLTDTARRAAALLKRGAMEATLQHDVRALADFGLSLRLEANNADVFIQRGLVHQRRGAYEQALVDFLAAQKLDHASGGEGYAHSVLQAQNAAYAQQVDNLDQNTPTTAAGYNERCWLRAIVGESLDNALADCNQSLKMEPDASEVLDSRGLVELKLQDYQAALGDYNAALSADPDRGHFLYGRGLAKIGLGDDAGGEADLDQAMRNEPGIDDAYYSYGINYD